MSEDQSVPTLLSPIDMLRMLADPAVTPQVKPDDTPEYGLGTDAFRMRAADKNGVQVRLSSARRDYD